jgi:hypothetical protein
LRSDLQAVWSLPLLGRGGVPEDLAKYAKALLTAEGKWIEGQDEKVKLHALEGRRIPEKVIGPLLETTLFGNLRDSLPQDNEKRPDIPKTLKLLQDIKDCSQQLMRAACDRLRPKINDIVFENAPPLNAENASVDRYQRPKASPLSDYEWLRFRLVEDDKSATIWGELRHVGLYKHDVSFTLVTTLGDRTVPLPTTIQSTSLSYGAAAPAPDADRFFLQIASPLRSVCAVAVFAIIAALLISLGFCTDLISDTSGVRRPDGIRPYSLSRAQMAFWFLVIIWASLFLWIATDTWHILNDTCLWLIGIGSGTALGSAIIGSSDPAKAAPVPKNPLTRRRGESLDSFQARLNNEINQSNVAPANETPQDAATRQARRDALVKQGDDLAQMPQIAWRRLMRDWLTDEDVYSFHRYQMLAWTLVLGLFFVTKVWARWELPTFDTTTLALLGVTSGTYLGFKLQKTQ